MDQMKNQITSLQQKAEQGSMQVQGEAQELIIEEFYMEERPIIQIQAIDIYKAITWIGTK